MKKFTIPCDFGGQKHPFAIYVGEPRDDRHPLQNQQHWLSSERGGSIPAEVMESFSKLHQISKENDVPFEELCMYALGQAAEEKRQQMQGAQGGNAAASGGSAPNAEDADGEGQAN